MYIFFRMKSLEFLPGQNYFFFFGEVMDEMDSKWLLSEQHAYGILH